MIVGVKNIDLYELSKYCTDVNTLREYSDSLVPRVLRHKKEILSNQRYLIALHIRYVESLTFREKAELSNALLADTSVTGIINEIYDWSDILTRVSMEDLCLLIGEDYEEKKILYDGKV